MRKWVWEPGQLVRKWKFTAPVWINKNTTFFSHQNKLPLPIGVEAFEFLKTAQRGQAVWGHIGRGVFLAGVIALRRKKWKNSLSPHYILPFFVFYYGFSACIAAITRFLLRNKTWGCPLSKMARLWCALLGQLHSRVVSSIWVFPGVQMWLLVS